VTTLTIIGLDIAKSSFQIHGVAACGRTALRKKLRRGKVLEFFAKPRGRKRLWRMAGVALDAGIAVEVDRGDDKLLVRGPWPRRSRGARSGAPPRTARFHRQRGR
jgi:hypothetical protein